MTDAWPRNIVPYDEKKLRAFASPEHIALYEAAPLEEHDLTPAQRVIVEEMLAVGLMRREGTRILVTQRHRRDAPPGTPGSLEHKLAVAAHAAEVVQQTRNALDLRRDHAVAAIGVVSIPETPEAIASAFAILAEAEDQLRALTEELPHAGNEPVFRVLLFVGSSR